MNLDELQAAWAEYLAADAAWKQAEPRAFTSETSFDVMETAMLARRDAHEAVLRAVGRLLEGVPAIPPPVGLKEVCKRYGIDPKMRPVGEPGGVMLWVCLARMWRDSMNEIAVLMEEEAKL